VANLHLEHFFGAGVDAVAHFVEKHFAVVVIICVLFSPPLSGNED